MGIERVVMLADCESFYASMEKAWHPELRYKPVVVAGDPERRSGIILAACPLAKQRGVKTAQRLGEALALCPEAVVVRPHMQAYIEASMRITDIYRQFTDLVEPYSIDEQFLDVGGSCGLFGPPEVMASKIQERVYLVTGVRVRIGIARTKALAKMACDLYAKRNASGICLLTPATMREQVWPLPIRDLFMCGGRMSQHFTAMGLSTIGKLAETPLHKLKQMMRRRLGRQSDLDAELYWRLANGLDDSPVSLSAHHQPPRSIGHMMTLPRDYRTIEEIGVVLLELSELVCRRCRAGNYLGGVLNVSCQGSDFDYPSGFSRQLTLLEPTHVTNQVYPQARQLFARHWDGLPVRRLGVSLAALQVNAGYQTTLFDNREREREHALEAATDRLKHRYGECAVIRAISATDAGQARHRSQLIGGHRK